MLVNLTLGSLSLSKERGGIASKGAESAQIYLGKWLQGITFLAVLSVRKIV